MAEPDAPRPEPARAGTIYDSRPPPGPDGDGPSALAGRMARLRIGAHVASPGALARLGPPATPTAGLMLGGGLMLGADGRRQPVTLPVFRPEPTRLAVVGQAWVGRLLVFRALAFGARVAVVTRDPAAWQGLGERATGRGDRVAVLAAERPFALTATAHQPILLVYDLGTATPSIPPQLGPWQAQLTLLHRLDRAGVPTAQESQAVLLQRLDPAQAELAGTALHLPGSCVQFLQSLADHLLAVVDGHTERYVWLEPTRLEQQLIGATPHR